MSGSGEAITGISQQRKTEPKQLHRILHGDLDWIVMKALEKDRTRRYDTPLGRANDIRRHLNNEAVLARPPSTIYFIRRFVTRNRGVVTAASVIFFTLIAALIVVSRLFVREADARAKADKSAAKSKEIATFMKGMLESVSPSSAQGKNVTLLREILDASAARIGKDLADYPDVEAELRSVIGSTYEDVSEFKKALEMHSEVLRLRRTELPEDPVSIAQTMYNLSRAHDRLDNLSEAESAVREGIEIRNQVSPTDSMIIAKSRSHLAWLLFRQDKLAESESECKLALELLDDNHPDTTLVRANTLGNLSAVMMKAARFRESVEVQCQTVNEVRRINGEMHLAISAYSIIFATLWSKPPLYD